MRFGKVIGNVVLNQQVDALTGARWIVVAPMEAKEMKDPGAENLTKTPSCVIYDNLGAGVGDVVGFTEGAEATVAFEVPIPIDSYNAAIVDQINYVGC